jgi:hypothetical protein
VKAGRFSCAGRVIGAGRVSCRGVIAGANRGGGMASRRTG